MSADAPLDEAWQHIQSGRLTQAAAQLEGLLARRPDHAVALNLLGIVAARSGRAERALELLGRAIALDPAIADFHNNAGEVWRSLGRWDEAEAAFRGALAVQPSHFEAAYNLGLVRFARGRTVEAMHAFRDALGSNPQFSKARVQLGLCFQRLGRPSDAVGAYREALKTDPDSAGAHTNLGAALFECGELDAAGAAMRTALARNPDDAVAHYNLGILLEAQRKPDEAIAQFRLAIGLNDRFPEALDRLGGALKDRGDVDGAVAAYRASLSLRADARTLGDLAIALRTRGDLEEAVATFRAALRLDPSHAGVHSALLLTLQLHPRIEPPALAREQAEWQRRHAQEFAADLRPHPNDRSPDRRLRIGYVSADLRDHVVGRFMLPLLEAHDRDRFEVFCYSSLRAPDDLTRRLRGASDAWRDIATSGDDEAAERIREDGIDILVDLSMHSYGNRLLVFARKPAPVQASYLAYPGATGLRSIDWRITDACIDPPGVGDEAAFERPMRLPASYWCYRAPQRAPAPGDLPAGRSGGVTFGCLNDFCKLSEPILKTWCALLRRVEASRLLLYVPEGTPRSKIERLMAAERIDPARLTFTPRVGEADYFSLYHRIDVALDPHPCAGGTTTLDALWMGVPVVSLAGEAAASRGGLVILSRLGLQALVAHDAPGYLRIATDLAADLPRLGELRAGLRARMLRSALMDERRFAHDLEDAYRRMWQAWCRTPLELPRPKDQA